MSYISGESRYRKCLGFAKILFIPIITMRGKRLSDEFCKVIYKQRDAGMTIRKIAAILEIQAKSVQRVLKRRQASTSNQIKQQLGRPRCTDSRTDGQILLALKRNRFEPYTDRAKQFSVSQNTIRRLHWKKASILALPLEMYSKPGIRRQDTNGA